MKLEVDLLREILLFANDTLGHMAPEDFNDYPRDIALDQFQFLVDSKLVHGTYIDGCLCGLRGLTRHGRRKMASVPDSKVWKSAIRSVREEYFLVHLAV